MGRYDHYIHGSAAPKLPRQVENPVEQQKVVRREAARPVSKTAHLPKGRMLLAIMFVVVVCFVILYRFCYISDLNIQMGKLTKRYDELRDENRKLNVAIETSIDLDRIKEVAETKLNMHAPDQNQLVLVNVPKSNYSVVMDYSYIDSGAYKTSPMENFIKAAKSILP